jgi:hypothetical protein
MSIRKANASRFVIPHPLLYLPYRVLSFTYFIYYIPESDIRGILIFFKLLLPPIFLIKRRSLFLG